MTGKKPPKLIAPQPKHINDIGKSRNYHVSLPDLAPPFSNQEMALAMMQILSLWSYTEMRLGLVFINLLGSNPVPAAEAFNAIHATKSQIAAIQACAASILTDLDYRVFCGLMLVHKELYDYRNAIAHGIFGYEDGNTSAFIYVDSRSLLKTTARKRSIGEFDSHEIGGYIYTMEDLARIRAGINVYSMALHACYMALNYRKPRKYDLISPPLSRMPALYPILFHGIDYQSIVRKAPQQLRQPRPPLVPPLRHEP